MWNYSVIYVEMQGYECRTAGFWIQNHIEMDVDLQWYGSGTA